MIVPGAICSRMIGIRVAALLSGATWRKPRPCWQTPPKTHRWPTRCPLLYLRFAIKDWNKTMICCIQDTFWKGNLIQMNIMMQSYSKSRSRLASYLINFCNYANSSYLLWVLANVPSAHLSQFLKWMKFLSLFCDQLKEGNILIFNQSYFPLIPSATAPE